MRVVAIGGTGFIGSRVVNRLAALGHEVVVVHRGERESTQASGLRHVHCEMTNVAALTALECDIALHGFALTQVHAEAFVRAFGPSARRLVVLSSGDVYRAAGVIWRSETAEHEPGNLDEEAPLRRVLRPFAGLPEYEKIEVERVVMAAGASNCVLRLPAVFGEGDPHHRIGVWLRQMSTIYGDFLIGERYARWRWSHGYVDNVAEAVAQAVIDDSSGGRIYNVAEPEAPTMMERIARVGEAFGWKGKFVMKPDEEMPEYSKRPLDFAQDLVMDSRRIRTELGFAETVDDQEALARTIRWEVETGYAGRPS